MAIDTPARIAILGAGPIGLEAALYARYLGYDVDVYERGRVADNVRAWGHVRMFSPFAMNCSPLGVAALKAQDPDWKRPADDALITGRAYADAYLLRLAQSDLLADGLHEDTEVVAVARDGHLKGELAGDEGRGDNDFRILLRSTRPDDHGRERYATADVVIDATGTYGHHNWLGAGGLPALGERNAEPHIVYGIDDVLGEQRDRYASRRTLLVGGGHSAATSLVALAELAAQAPDTWITWVTRADGAFGQSGPVTPVPDDSLAERMRITELANRLASDDANHVTLLAGTTVEAVAWHGDLDRFSVRLAGKHADELEFDRLIANVGYRPDPGIYSELQVGASPETGAALQPIDEPDFYVLGAKSRGRDSRFLIADGLEQIRFLFAVIGDRAELNLYATMVGLC